MDEVIAQLDFGDPSWAAVAEDYLQERGHGPLGLVSSAHASCARLWALLPLGARPAVIRAIAMPMLAGYQAPPEVCDGLRRSCEEGRRPDPELDAALDEGPLEQYGLAAALRRPGADGAWCWLLHVAPGPDAAGGVHPQVRELLHAVTRLARPLRAPTIDDGRPRRRPVVLIRRTAEGWLVAPVSRMGEGRARVLRRRLVARPGRDEPPRALAAALREQLGHSRVRRALATQLPLPLSLDAEDAGLAARLPEVSADSCGHATVRGRSGGRLWIWPAGRGGGQTLDLALDDAALGALLARYASGEAID